MDLLQAHDMRIPQLGLGTYRLQGDECRAAVESALALGYRHIDTAEMYGNEDAVGEAIAHGGVPREELHVTTKVWWQNIAPDAMRRAMEQSLTKLRLNYVDFYLIHWPAPEMDLAASLAALVRLRDEGLARHVGVCNFPLALLRRAVEEIGAPVVGNQIEYHVLLSQDVLLPYMREKGLLLTAYAPLAQGRLAEHADLQRIAEKHGATPAQVALKWLLDQGVAAIPKAGRRESQQANLDALKLKLDDEDRAAIGRLPKDQRFVRPAFAPQWDNA